MRLRDDFNTPKALASLFEWVREANRRGAEGWGTPICARCSACLDSSELTALEAAGRRGGDRPGGDGAA